MQGQVKVLACAVGTGLHCGARASYGVVRAVSTGLHCGARTNYDGRVRCEYRATYMVMVQGQVTVLVGGAITWLHCGARPSYGVN